MNAEQRATAERLLPMSEGIARRHSRDPDAVGVAALAMCEAVARYTPDRGDLDVYVAMWVRRAVRRMDPGDATVDPSVLEAMVSDTPASGELPATPHPEVAALLSQGYTTREIAERMGVGVSQVRHWRRIIRNFMSLGGG